MLKKDIRKEYRKKRLELSAVDRNRWDDLLLIQFQTVEVPPIGRVLSFYPIEEYNEINSFLFTDYLHFRNPGLEICYPRMREDKIEMDAVVCRPDSIFETNGWNIPEPVDGDIADPATIDLILVPVVAIDQAGVRVGYGKGFYDRYLKQTSSDCITVGLSYFEPVDRIDDPDPFDVPLKLCVTPTQVYVF